MCCALIALYVAILAAWQTGFKTLLARRVKIAAFVITAIVPIVGSALAIEHMNHYITRAENNQRSVLAEIMAQPICTGKAIR
jgi:predicted RND superfamily exporter protein